MKRCFACEALFASDEWICPCCGYSPPRRDGILRFAEDPPEANGGFKPEFFPRLAQLEPDNFWFRARNQLIQWALRTYFSNATSFFEIGCGTGFVLAGLRENFPQMRLAGSEIYGAGLACARVRLPGVDLFQMDARRILFAQEFDVVGAFDVLEHLAEDEVALAQMFQVTRPGGGILVSVPQHHFLWSASDEHAKHQRRYDRAELRRKIERAGFSIERIISFVSLLLPLMICSRMQQKRERKVQPWRELEMNPALNRILESILSIERAMIKRGVSFPAGGSLLAIAKRPVAPP